LEESLPDTAKQGLEAMFEAALRASRIVKNLLTFARRQVGRKSLVDINDLIERTLALKDYQLRVNNIEVVRDYFPALPQTVADASQLQQVFFNLITNAEQAMLEAHGRGRLVIRTQPLTQGDQRQRATEFADGALAGDSAAGEFPSRWLMNQRSETVSYWIEITLTDDGPGIPEAHLHRLFEPFFTTKPVGQGTGLGLSISHGIIHDHGGRITARSHLSQGATFIVQLPIVDQPVLVVTQSPELPPPRQITSKRILIVDDEPTIAALFEKVVVAEGHRADVALNGREALLKLTGQPYDLIFCDMKMPDLSGRDIYDEAKRFDPALADRFVFVTGDVISPDTRAFFERTGSVVIEKPFTNRDAIRVMRLLLADL
jgi:two-component system NtrC family sensor kinase